MNLIFLILFLVLILIYINWDIIDKFDAYQTYQSYIPLNTYKFPFAPLINPANSGNWWNYFIPNSNGYTNLPWWNTSLGNTRNMSYDIRGDPNPIPRTNFVWNNGTTFPIYNKMSC